APMRGVRSKAILFLILGLSTALLVAQDARIEEAGKSPVEAKFAANGQIHMHLCPSGVSLVGRDENVLRVSYSPTNEDVRVRLKVSGSDAELRVTGCPHNNFQ